ncbi:hypothetical protein DXG01_007018 [Tephrocybe rancida]|nr:hypothetical protein DXG01_007018 [Tephrocybe rancida]
MGGSAIRLSTNSSYNDSLSFTGTSLSLFGSRSALPTDDPAWIAIDGGKPTEFGQHPDPDPNLDGYLIYTSPQLANTSHTIRVSNPGSFIINHFVGPVIDIDYATVELGSNTPLTGMRLIVDDMNPFMTPDADTLLSAVAVEHKSAISGTTPPPIEGHYVLPNDDTIRDIETHWSFRRFFRFSQMRGLPRVEPFRGVSYPVTANIRGPQHKQPSDTSPRIVVPPIAVRGQEVDTTSILSATVVAPEGAEDPRSRIDHLRYLVEFQREIDQAEPPRSV